MAQSNNKNAATHAARNQSVWYQAGGMMKSSESPCSEGVGYFRTPPLSFLKTQIFLDSPALSRIGALSP